MTASTGEVVRNYSGTFWDVADGQIELVDSYKLAVYC
jgi:hypothetical protein